MCPHCGTQDPKHYFIVARSGERRTASGNVTYRRIWRCRACRKQFSVLVGTIFESSKVPVSKWLLALWLVSAGKNAISALELKRHLEPMSYQTAWFMLHRIREAMLREPLWSLLSGTVVADETFVGGKPANKHRQGRPARLPEGGRGVSGRATDKVPVMALVSKDTGEVRTRVVADVTGHTLRKALADDVDMARTVLHTDGHKGYQAIR
ncbi:MAG TPA: IS1595 family transposase, partial [Acidimicrobiales bacterium]|nr:IS1595 family transposase [Acidimicrobiales bacterium]